MPNNGSQMGTYASPEEELAIIIMGGDDDPAFDEMVQHLKLFGHKDLPGGLKTMAASRAYLTHDQEEKVTDLDFRLNGYKTAVRALEPVARVDEELAAELERLDAKVALLTAEIKGIEQASYKQLEKARFDSNGVKFKQGDKILLVANHGMNWRSIKLNGKSVTITRQTAERLEFEVSPGETVTLHMDPNRSFEPAYLVTYYRDGEVDDTFQLDHVFVLSGRTSDVTGAE